ncbi:transcription factor bHLH30-like [Rhododendron vialii]|uniref:transcription factor bHLH30-like n=1 Tax=Rhododendron vialii TaxID=182163 RepID=UPI0026603821|nr:transcription factor bHLH30-like [Rhododendron vialii]
MICGKKELEEAESFQEQLLLEQFPWSLPPIHYSFNPAHFDPNPVHDHNPFLLPPSVPSPYGGLLFSRGSSEHDHLRLVSEAVGHAAAQYSSSSAPFGLQAELDKMTAQEMMDAKALAASKSHSEAERRRRERINNHLARLRSLLPNTTKTDKASLLAEVIQHVKELKRQTSQIAETSPVPAEVDELTVDASDENGSLVIKASLCCEDRSDLLPDLIRTLKALRLRTLKAEITTLGGRMRNVLFVTAEEESNGDEFGDQHRQDYSVSSIQEAFRAVMGRRNGDECSTSSGGVTKRHRTNVNMVENRSL